MTVTIMAYAQKRLIHNAPNVLAANCTKVKLPGHVSAHRDGNDHHYPIMGQNASSLIQNQFAQMAI